MLAGDTRPLLDDRSIGAALRDQAAARGNATALYWLDEHQRVARLSYRELYRAASGLAQRLRAELPAGSRIAVWAPNSPAWVILEYASALAGAILTPINPAVTDGELLALVRQSGPGLLYAATEFRGMRLLDRAREVTSGVATKIRALDELLVTDAAGPEIAVPLPEVAAQAPFLLQYTSGTTGRPKGALLSHSAAYNAARFSAQRLGLTAEDVWLCPLPLHHVGGSVCILLPMLSVGGAVALASGWDLDQVVELVAASHSTVIGTVPTMMIDLAGHPGAADGRLASLRLLQGGGSTVAPALISRVESTLGVCVVVAYGQSEAPVTISCRPDDSAQDKALTIGCPLPHRDVRIAAPVTGQTVMLEEVGELQIRSPLSMIGFWHDADATAAAIDSDGWLHSGDLCSMDERGMIRIHGRHRDLIIRGGENIFPADVEEVLLRHPDISDAAVVGAPSDRWGEEPVAFVRAKDGARLDPGELDAWVRDRLAGYCRPRRWYFVDALPLTASGKVQKYVLRERLTRSAEPGL